VSQDKATKIEDNRVVALAYKLSDSEGKELDQATSEEPVIYLHGHGNIVPGLEEALAGRGVGEKFDVELPPDEAFGPRLDDAERVLPRDAFPEELELEPGLELALDDDGEVVPFWIKEVVDNRVTIDLNHPFAGLTLRFAGEVLKIREATESELEHGHPHGDDGSHAH
jgi:FKBP-type peptidyl-prolyl cis-trans isomerase SlyD